MKKILILLSLVLLLSGCEKTKIISEEADMSGYKKLEEKYYKRFKAIKLDGLQDLIENNKTAYIYLGYTGCEHCQDLVKELVQLNKKVTFYYLDAMYVVSEEEIYNKTIEYLNDALEENDENKKTIQTPEIIKFVNGKITDYYLGYEEGNEEDIAQYREVLKES